MKRLMRYIWIIVVGSFIFAGASLPVWADTTPTSVNITLYKTELSTDGKTWVTVFDDTNGRTQDLMNNPDFGSGSITPGTYNWIRFNIGDTLSWSAPDPCGGATPVSQSFGFNDDPDFVSGGGVAYFATSDQKGRPDNSGWGTSDPLLLSQPIVVGTGGTTDVDLIFGFSNAVVCGTGGTAELNAPTIFVTSADADASGLAATYNVVAYQVYNNGAGDWDYLSFWGDLTFDGSSGWTATLTSSEQPVGSNATIAATTTHNGMYGLNSDGSIWMTVNGVHATLRGGLSSDKDTFVATVIDGQDYNMIFYGLKQPTDTFDSSVFSENYAFDGYYASYTGTAPADTLYYGLTIGDMTFTPRTGTTDTIDISGWSSENNLVVSDPTGGHSYGGGPQYIPSLFPFSDSFTISSNGTCVTSTRDIWCAGLSDGLAGIYVADIQDPPDRQEFGILIKKSSNLLDDSDLSGSYFGAFFGDEYLPGPPESNVYYSGSFVAQFNGAGSVTAEVMVNEGGSLVIITETANYTVDTVDGQITISDTNGTIFEGQLSADGEVLLFYSPLEVPAGSGTANNKRELGLMVRLP